MFSCPLTGTNLIALTLTHLNHLEPLPSVVDVGAGIGAYSCLMRKFLPDAQWIAVDVVDHVGDGEALKPLYDTVLINDGWRLDTLAGSALIWVILFIPLFQIRTC